jgi:hypothetical protein
MGDATKADAHDARPLLPAQSLPEKDLSNLRAIPAF